MKYGLYLTAMYYYWLISCNKYVILMKDVNNGGNMACDTWGPHISFSVSLKLFFKELRTIKK